MIHFLPEISVNLNCYEEYMYRSLVLFITAIILINLESLSQGVFISSDQPFNPYPAKLNNLKISPT